MRNKNGLTRECRTRIEKKKKKKGGIRILFVDAAQMTRRVVVAPRERCKHGVQVDPVLTQPSCVREFVSHRHFISSSICTYVQYIRVKGCVPVET